MHHSCLRTGGYRPTLVTVIKGRIEAEQLLITRSQSAYCSADARSSDAAREKERRSRL